MLVDKDIAFSPWCSPVKPIGCVHVAPIEERKGEGGWVGVCVCVRTNHGIITESISPLVFNRLGSKKSFKRSRQKLHKCNKIIQAQICLQI